MDCIIECAGHEKLGNCKIFLNAQRPEIGVKLNRMNQRCFWHQSPPAHFSETMSEESLRSPALELNTFQQRAYQEFLTQFFLPRKLHLSS